LIRVDVSLAVCLYVLCSLAAVFVLWIFFEKKAVLPKFVREEADVWECSICAYIYVDSTHHAVPAVQELQQEVPGGEAGLAARFGLIYSRAMFIMDEVFQILFSPHTGEQK
jgi:hypothetical protein